jgi:predicted acyl esterase
VYHSDPLAEDLLLAGMPRVDLWVSMDVPDTDLKVALYQIMPDGKSLLLGEDMLRARYRKSLREPELVPAGSIEHYRFERLTWNSRLLKKYSRLRLVIACLNSIFEQKNYNSGGDVMRETPRDARTAQITVHHAAPYASAIVLPLGTIATSRRLEFADVAPYLQTSADDRPQG